MPLSIQGVLPRMRAQTDKIYPMQFSYRALLMQAALFMGLTGCAGPKPVVYTAEKFDSADIYSRRFPVPGNVACEAVRRTLLSQGYVINAATHDQVDGRKSFQPESDVHVQIAFRVVCAADNADGTTSSVFVNALEDRYALKKTNNSASLGVGALGSVSLPFSSSDDSLVKVSSETIAAEKFYARFFQLVERYLTNEATPATESMEITQPLVPTTKIAAP
ncbi:DUF2242 domain-containing protein [Herminiimonas fonticola]|uniref:Uncharacterized protein DUF2242 n=1 Tax=Herminiimonas fonticola TaxID=303380 RepID=A0A4R6GGE1_9BURK|nr:DUF2242 domain-containing protein [Herminiimonas fonticola]RBA24743.1 hypothetical protein Hfont_0376 [Herminiimonas fonticola]TDN93857.1 uncharacterized protein DUF2242 [Herminiimonas fonticola]